MHNGATLVAPSLLQRTSELLSSLTSTETVPESTSISLQDPSSDDEALLRKKHGHCIGSLCDALQNSGEWSRTDARIKKLGHTHFSWPMSTPEGPSSSVPSESLASLRGSEDPIRETVLQNTMLMDRARQDAMSWPVPSKSKGRVEIKARNRGNADAMSWPAQGPPPQVSPSVMSWPDEEGPDGNGNGVGLWMWPSHPVLWPSHPVLNRTSEPNVQSQHTDVQDEHPQVSPSVMSWPDEVGRDGNGNGAGLWMWPSHRVLKRTSERNVQPQHTDVKDEHPRNIQDSENLSAGGAGGIGKLKVQGAARGPLQWNASPDLSIFATPATKGQVVSGNEVEAQTTEHAEQRPEAHDSEEQSKQRPVRVQHAPEAPRVTTQATKGKEAVYTVVQAQTAAVAAKSNAATQALEAARTAPPEAAKGNIGVLSRRAGASEMNARLAKAVATEVMSAIEPALEKEQREISKLARDKTQITIKLPKEDARAVGGQVALLVQKYKH